MTKLSAVVKLDLSVIEALAKIKVFSVLDFIKADVEKLSSSSSLSLKEILELKEKLVTSNSPVPVSGLELYKKALKNSALIITHIDSIDRLLEGGLQTGCLYEIFGLSGSGKSEICLSIVATVISSLMRNVVYIDTKKKFSPKRLHSILSCRKLSPEIVNESMKRLEVISPSDIYELMSALYGIKDSLCNKEKHTYRLLVIDSITAPYLPLLSTEPNQGNALLNNIALLLKYIAKEFHICILITNLGVQYSEDNSSDEVKPALGRFWQTVANYHIFVSISSNRNITLLESSSSEGLHFKITNEGVT